MKRTLCTLIFLLSLGVQPPGAAGAGLVPYAQTRGDWVVTTGEYPYYPTFEAARAKKGEAGTTLPGLGWRVLEKRDGRLRVESAYDASEEAWLEADETLPLDAVLQNPGDLRDLVMLCGPDLPLHFTVDLDAGRKGAVISITTYPTLGGGGGVMGVWDSGKTALLWQSSPLEKTGPGEWDAARFICTDFGTNWPQLIGDVDGDGKAEMLIKGPQSEIGPGEFAIMRWNGAAFALTGRNASFVAQGAKTPKILARVEGESVPDLSGSALLVWIDDWLRLLPDGTCEVGATVFQQWKFASGTARVRVVPDGGVNFVQWVKEPGELKEGGE